MGRTVPVSCKRCCELRGSAGTPRPTGEQSGSAGTPRPTGELRGSAGTPCPTGGTERLGGDASPYRRTEGLGRDALPYRRTERLGRDASPYRRTEGLGRDALPYRRTEGLGGDASPYRKTEGLGGDRLREGVNSPYLSVVTLSVFRRPQQAARVHAGCSLPGQSEPLPRGDRSSFFDMTTAVSLMVYKSSPDSLARAAQTASNASDGCHDS